MALYVQANFPWHINEGPPMRPRIDSIQADGDELEHIYRHTGIERTPERVRDFTRPDHCMKILSLIGWVFNEANLYD